jgi:copper(I)-binding protein
MDGDHMMMRKVESIAVEQGVFEFNPGGYHIMFIGLKTEPEKGDTIPVTFTFASGDTLTVPFDVRPVGVE